MTTHHTDHPKPTAAEKKAKHVKHGEADLRDAFAIELAAASLPSALDHPESVAAWATTAYVLADALLVARDPVDSKEPEA